MLEKEKEIYKLKTAIEEIIPESKMKFSEFGSQFGGVGTNSYIMQTDLTSSQLKNNARRFISNQKQQEEFFKN